MKSKEHKEREKSRKYLEVTAVLMLIISIVLAVLSAVLAIKLFKATTKITTSTAYAGVKVRDKENDQLDEVMKLMKEVENIYEECYVLDIEREEIDECVVNGLVYAYGDKYAVYRDLGDTYVTNNSKNNLIMGIGIYTKAEYEDYEDEFTIYLIDVYKNSPAEKAGLEIGDTITKVNGKSFSKTKYDYSKLTDDIRGEEGTTVEITYLDASDNNKEKTVTITRGAVTTRSVICEEITDDIAYITIREFDAGTDEEIIGFIDELQSKGIKKYIFDLRDNGGGIKDTAVNILDYLLPEGLIMKEINKNGNTVSKETSDKNYIDFESVCLINEGTASASELMVQTLKDYGKTTTIGEKTLGKATVCTWIPLSNGSSIYVSTGKYRTKSDVEIEEVGITPDIELKMHKDKEDIRHKLELEEDELIMKAVELLKD